MVGSELRGLVQVVQLQAGSRHHRLEHFLLPVVDGDLQVADGGLRRRSHDLRRVYCKQVAQGGGSVASVGSCLPVVGMTSKFQREYLHIEPSGLAACVAGSQRLRNSHPRQLGSADCNSQPTVAPLSRMMGKKTKQKQIRTTQLSFLLTNEMNFTAFPKTTVPATWFPISIAVKLLRKFCCRKKKTQCY